MTLAELKDNESAIITKVKGLGAFRKRVTEMGFVKGKTIRTIKAAPLKDPIQYSIMDYEVSLRKSEAQMIEIVTESEVNHAIAPEMANVRTDEIMRKKAIEKGKTIHVALVGNPNSGKTSFFNVASKSQEHVGNYSGVTVDAKTSSFKYKSYRLNITDLPGTYSLSAYTPEELFVRRHILEASPDVIINVVDASNLERNMYLSTQLIDMDVKIVMALNMYDELQKNATSLDFIKLGSMIGCPIIPTVSSKGTGIYNVLDRVIDVFEDRSEVQRFVRIDYGPNLELAIEEITKELNHYPAFFTQVSPRFAALKILEKDADIEKEYRKYQLSGKTIKKLNETKLHTEQRVSEDIESYIADSRYGFIAGALKQTLKKSPISRRRKTDMIDNVLTNKALGFPLFLFFMWLMFQSTFTLGEFPMNWIDSGIVALSELINIYMPEGMLKDLIIDGIIGGVGGVIIFLPNILILFFFISVMEDTGYMARAAFIMDKIMNKFGLHGKSFIPLIMGFGCNVPAIMATRTLENWKDRMLTMLINPFMSCSARLPVHLLIISAFFPNNKGLILFGVYMFGIIVAGIVALLFKNTLFRGKEAPFVMELPPYRMPTLRSGLHHMWFKAKEYIYKMGGIILVASIIIWAMGYFPRQPKGIELYEQQINVLKQSIQQGKHSDLEELKAQKEREMEAFRQENSFIGKMGHAFAPILQPLGFDWKMSVSILTGIVAKEIVVSTMGVLYQVDEADDEHSSLAQKIKNEKYTSGSKKGELVMDKIVALSFIAFILLYFPCIAVIAAIKRESGSWKWAAFTVLYTTGIAYFIALIINQIGHIIV
jgi:ferrous iron transport protein B